MKRGDGETDGENVKPKMFPCRDYVLVSHALLRFRREKYRFLEGGLDVTGNGDLGASTI